MAFLPDPQHRHEVKFIFAKSLPYNVRLTVTAVLLVVGLAVQLAAGVPYGLPLLLAATLVNLVRGYDNQVRDPVRKKEWAQVTRQEFERVVRIQRQSREWDQAAADITCVPGFLLLAVTLALGALGGVGLAASGHERLAVLWVADLAVLVVPHWFVGVRSILTNAPLVVKVGVLGEAAVEAAAGGGDTVAVQYMLELGQTKAGATPVDAKVIATFAKAPPEFLGLQMQVTLNNVQGADYPYFYCVLVARQRFGLLNGYEPHQVEGITVEAKRQRDTDVIVVRQTTTKTSGYHTGPKQVRALTRHALAEARAILAARASA